MSDDVDPAPLGPSKPKANTHPPDGGCLFAGGCWTDLTLTRYPESGGRGGTGAWTGGVSLCGALSFHQFRRSPLLLLGSLPLPPEGLLLLLLLLLQLLTH